MTFVWVLVLSFVALFWPLWRIGSILELYLRGIREEVHKLYIETRIDPRRSGGA